MSINQNQTYIPEIAEERFVKILEAIPDATVIINKEGDIIFINSQTVNLFGFERKELVGQKVEILIPEPYRKRHPEHRIHYFQSPKIRPMGIGMELFGQRKNGEVFPVEISLSPLDTKDNTITLATIRDITERKRFEQTLKEKNMELETANLAKDRFLASMSHELRTPLNAIMGFTGTLLMKLPGPLNKEQENQLNIIKNSSNHLLSLINDLLNLAKIESGKIELNPELIDIQKLIQEINVTLSPLAQTKNLQLNIDLPKDKIIMDIDKRALTQIIINLANNAIKFTDKGNVTIKLEKQIINNMMYVCLHIIDTGIGIKLTDQTRLFQAFQQMQNPRKHVEGTGLGLHLSKKLAELIEGKIEFESEFGKGSRFSILLPYNQE